MKTAILGFGVEGKSTYQYLRGQNPRCEIDIFDQAELTSNDVKITTVSNFTDIDYSPYDMIVRSPSIPPDAVFDKIAQDHGGSHDFTFTSATQIFFDRCPAPIIGVTGTKGKGTTCSLISSILTAAGRNNFLVGNIGTPALDILSQVAPNDVIVYELSSFQLWNLNRSPQVAVILTIAPDHLDIHDNFDQYVSAKTNITKFQNPSDIVIYLETNSFAHQIAESSPSQNKLAFPSSEGAHISDNSFFFAEHKICSIDVLALPGKHNQENTLAAISAIWQFTQDSQAIESGIQNFHGLPHRIEFIRELGGVSYYDDSFSSASPALEVAIQAFPCEIVLIAGGFDRGLDLSPISSAINSAHNIKKTILIGQTKHKIATGLRPDTYIFADTLEEAISVANSVASRGDIVLLSPGCPSFDMFKNFSDRGDQYQKLIRNLS